MLGLSEVQFNKDHTYPNGRTDNQLRVLEHLGIPQRELVRVKYLLRKTPWSRQQPNQREPKPTGMLHAPPSALRSSADPDDKTQPLDLRAKAYLHANCATCHVEAGGGNAQMQLDFSTEWAKMRLINVKPVHQTFELAEASSSCPARRSGAWCSTVSASAGEHRTDAPAFHEPRRYRRVGTDDGVVQEFEEVTGSGIVACGEQRVCFQPRMGRPTVARGEASKRAQPLEQMQKEPAAPPGYAVSDFSTSLSCR